MKMSTPADWAEDGAEQAAIAATHKFVRLSLAGCMARAGEHEQRVRDFRGSRQHGRSLGEKLAAARRELDVLTQQEAGAAALTTLRTELAERQLCSAAEQRARDVARTAADDERVVLDEQRSSAAAVHAGAPEASVMQTWFFTPVARASVHLDESVRALVDKARR